MTIPALAEENQTHTNPVLLGGGPFCLNLGGREHKVPGFLNIDINPGPEVDIIGDISDLSEFKDGSVEKIYVSHALEHFRHTETLEVLKEWHRVLKPGGLIYISVPDMGMIFRTYQKFGWCDWIRDILYGQQTHEFAYHYNGFDYSSLARYLIDAGFKDVKRLKEMPYGNFDRSHDVLNYTNEPVSLNVEAIK